MRGPQLFLPRLGVAMSFAVAAGVLVAWAAPAEASGAATWTNLTSSANPVLLGQAVTFTATVKAIGGGTPTGTATLKDGTVTLGTGTLDAFGKATFTTSSLALGTHPITAVYGGDGSLAPSTSDVLQQAVPQHTACSTASFFQPAGSPVSVGSNPLSTVVGDFNLDGKPDLAVPDYVSTTVTILLGNGNGGFSPGTGSPVSAGTHPLSVAVGDFNLDGAPDLAVANNSSRNVTILISNCGALASATMLSSSGPNPSAFGQTVTFTATVSAASGPGTPTGQVQLRDGASNLGSPSTLSGGIVTLTASALEDGPHSITAVYSGDPNFVGSTSSALNQIVLPRLSINDPTANAANGPTTFNFTVWLSVSSNLTVTVHYATSDRTAKAGLDYTATSGSLTFNPGETSKQVAVEILGQSVPGPSKEFFLSLTSPTNATFARGGGIGTIIYSGTGILTLYIDDPSLSEGNTGITLLGFTVSLSKANSTTVTVDYATADGTAIAGTDYTAKSGTVTFPPGYTSRAILIPILANMTVEPNKTLFVNLSTSSGAAIGKN